MASPPPPTVPPDSEDDRPPRAAVARYLAPIFEGRSAGKAHRARERGRMLRSLDEPGKVNLLACFASGLTVTASCMRVGVSPTTYYHERERDPAFAEAADVAREAGTDLLVTEATRRAVEGILEPVYHQGELVGEKRKYSDTLLLALLGARAPDFRKSAQAQGAIPPDDPSINVGVVVVPGQSESPDAWAAQVKASGITIDHPGEPGQE